MNTLQVLYNIFHVELEFKSAGKTKVSRKKPLRATERTNNKLDAHYGDNVIRKIC